MIKLAGCIMIIFSFVLGGQKIALVRRRRLAFLENMRLSLADFKAAVEVFSLPVPEALTKSGINDCNKDGILNEDGNDLSVFIKGTKAETIEGQILNINAYEKKLETEEEKERAKYMAEARLIKGGFILIGFLLALLLI